MKRTFILSLIAVSAFAQTPPAAGGAAADPNGLFAIVKTSMGNIKARLFEAEAPNTVKNFVALAQGTRGWMDPQTRQLVKKPLYNDITFHRVIPSFMIQTGDPTATGSHNCGFTIPDEISKTLKFDVPGRLAMANIGSPNTGGCQWFITEVPYASLNGGYTIFGQVVEGQDLVGKISHVPRDGNDKPRTAVKLITVAFERVGPAPAAPPAPAAKAAKKSSAPAEKK